MIYNLRRKFIAIAALSVSIVFVLIFSIILIVSSTQLNRTMDLLTDAISGNGGRFPEFGEMQLPPSPNSPPRDRLFTPETQFSTRFFTVWTDAEHRVIGTNVERISSVSKEEAENYAAQAFAEARDRGWIGDYRYKIYDTGPGKSVVFVNGEINRGTTLRLLYIVFFVMIGSFVFILFIIILFSKRAVKPAAESYEKQRQFVTDANHELKTPLTLILSNTDIVEAEIGQNEWLDDIRSEGNKMSVLINQLITLSRMDEDSSGLSAEEFALSNTISDTVSEFESLASGKDKTIHLSIESDMRYIGDEGLIRRLISILLDNAVKYCDPGGEIVVAAYTKGRSHIITVENTYQKVECIELERLFDRFYRADKTRAYTGSFGIGLSIAKSIAKLHKGDIIAYKKDASHIGFRAALK